jgi:hypothetical protein
MPRHEKAEVVKKERKPPMIHKDQIRETIIEETFTTSDSSDTGLDTELDTGMAAQGEPGEIFGEGVSHQQQLLENLARLYDSLRGPDDLLDQEGYSRPFPPQKPVVRQSTRRR